MRVWTSSNKGLRAPGRTSEAMTTDAPEPEPLYSRYRLAYPSGTVVEPYYAGGATLGEVRVTHPLAMVERAGALAEALERGVASFIVGALPAKHLRVSVLRPKFESTPLPKHHLLERLAEASSASGTPPNGGLRGQRARLS